MFSGCARRWINPLSLRLFVFVPQTAFFETVHAYQSRISSNPCHVDGPDCRETAGLGIGGLAQRDPRPRERCVPAPQGGCLEGVREGWLCEREGGGTRYGRVFKPEDALQRFSVDVVDMQNLAGPHHSHPGGEIDLIMPLEGEATFDGHPAGWCVYPPGSAHFPTVAQGRALVLYLLPEGQIQFTR